MVDIQVANPSYVEDGAETASVPHESPAGGIGKSWHDLPNDVVEIILSRVSLLRLAQMATRCRDIRAAYVGRLSTHVRNVSWLDNAMVPFPTDASAVLSAESYIMSSPTWGSQPRYTTQPTRIVTDFEVPPHLSGWATRKAFVKHLLLRPGSLEVGACFSSTLHNTTEPSDDFYYASVEVRSEVVVVESCRTLTCNELILRGGDWITQVPPTLKCLKLLIAMAIPLHKFLREVAEGPRHGQNGLSRLRLVQRLTLVLAPETPWPDAAGEAAICEALTCVLAIVGGKPSGTRIALHREGSPNEFRNSTYDITDWRLPCMIEEP